ncbi:MAG TPA: hypothetical protein VMX55_08890 [candidate division Zixibacteria bacterium]|nr:hypothetical protein [candidate division Zixibacteria bacterium]
MELEKKRKVSLILTIISAVILILGITGLILGVWLAITHKTELFWVSMTGILPLSIILGIIALIFDISYRKEKKNIL